VTLHREGDLLLLCLDPPPGPLKETTGKGLDLLAATSHREEQSRRQTPLATGIFSFLSLKYQFFFFG
jgi:hypothetical protein